MLRELVGDATLSAALRAYNPAADVSLGYGRDTGPSPFEKLLEQAGTQSDLSWFFNDWINADKGLPDLTISSVFPTPEQAGSWLITVNVANNGFAAAQVAVTARTESASVTQRLIVPARGKAPQRLLVLGRPVEVQVNNGTVPETEATVHISKIDAPGAGDAPAAAPKP
jgi:hypothetical protein